MKIAVKFEVIKGRIQLFDGDGNKLHGKGTRWEGDFYCYNNQLTSLEGAPEHVGGGFSCSGNQITSLEGAPESVGGSFSCSGNQITSLEGAPESVGGSFYCYNNQITSLEGAPESVGGNFSCYNNQITSLEGAPESVGGSFYCENNQITSLEGAPSEHKPMFSVFLSAGYVFADNILTRKKSQRKISAKITLYKTERLGFKKNAPVVYVATDGKKFAHGDTAKIALEELAFKTGRRDLTKYKNMPLDTKKTPEEWARVYRMITGACQYGTREFMARKTLKKKYTLAEIIKETNGAFGHSKFLEVVG